MRLARRSLAFLLTVFAVLTLSASPSYACCCTPHDLCEATGIGC